MNYKKIFVQLLYESVFIQGSIAIILVGGMVFMYVTEMAVPGEFTSIVLLIVGFYFGSKANIHRHRKGNTDENTTN